MAAPLHDRLGDNIDAPTYENASVKTRRNVLLLGDHIGDLGMSDGLNYENRISAGFLNDNVENSLDSYRKTFDIVYLMLVLHNFFMSMHLMRFQMNILMIFLIKLQKFPIRSG
ncbi:7-methylguanosine phosphate-specific 5'-nucleotidase-like isoform X1 [Prunus dulcis]|uniref:7-methylguanosine phosphate-specific 5'-nucleotidase-like isoform X1 n=1 Tax=Prunus dulcis TaxID=3755 RepID=UPI001483AD50|nr:7-methylguanosine phosphate-specific 5'-nucleotidase-like isoform X1 [Prunus dulcis]